MRLGVVTDLHLTPDSDRQGWWNDAIRYDRGLPRLRAALGWFAEQDVEAVLMLGDLTEEGDLPSLRRALGALAEAAPAPTYVLGGNHDGPVLDALAGETAAPVALLDRLDGDGLRVVAAHARVHDEGGFTTPLDLPAGDELLVVVAHFPLVSRQAVVEGRGLHYAGDLRDAEATAAALRARRTPTAVLCGHLHVDDALVEGPLLQVVIPPLVEGDGIAAVVEVEAAPAPVVRRELRGLDAATSARAEWRFDGGAWR